MRTFRGLKMVLASAAAVTGIATCAVALAGPAAATSGCTVGACVDAATGDKDYTNHTQWVGTVTVSSSPTGGGGDMEAWTYQYYNAISSVSSYTFTVNEWVPTGNNVCGAVDYGGGSRAIACITITV